MPSGSSSSCTRRTVTRLSASSVNRGPSVPWPMWVPELDSVRTTPRQERHQRPERNDQNQGHHQGREANYVHPEAGGNTERRGQPQGRRSCDPGDVEPASHDCTGPDEADPARDLRSNARRVGDAIDAVRARDREQSGTDRDQGVGSNPGYLRSRFSLRPQSQPTSEGRSKTRDQINLVDHNVPPSWFCDAGADAGRSDPPPQTLTGLEGTVAQSGFNNNFDQREARFGADILEVHGARPGRQP